MTPYLAPRSSQRPSSATLQRRVQLTQPKAKTFASHSKSVRFEDSPASKNVGRSMSTKEGKFHFWKKKKEELRGSSKGSEAVFTPGVCDSPSSVRSAPSSMGNRTAREKKVYSPVHSLDGSETRPRSPGVNLDPNNVYDLYAVCNHLGTMTRGHYTAYCRNPADGHWYMFDDNHVQPLSDDQLVTAGAYLLFYVRQSLTNQVPPLSSTSSSSSSSGGSSHWAMHIPRFKLDLTGSLGSSEGTRSPNINEIKTGRLRLASTNSARSAPPAVTGGSRGMSPQSLSCDNESDLFSRYRGDNQSSISVPTSQQLIHTNTSLHQYQLSPPPNQYYHFPHTSPTRLQAVPSGRHASLRMSRPRESSPESSREQFMRRGTSFHGSPVQRGPPVQRSLTNSGRVVEMPLHPAYPSSGQGLSMPSRSIPNISADHNQFHSSSYPAPSRSIPDMAMHMSPPLSARFPHHDHTLHFMTPQPHRAASRSFSTGGGQPATESCV